MKRLQKKMIHDKYKRFPELKKYDDTDEADYNEPVERVEWRHSKTGTRKSGKPLRYLSSIKLKETPEKQFKTINKKFKKHSKRRSIMSLKSKIFGDKDYTTPPERKRHNKNIECVYCGKESDALYCSTECMEQDRRRTAEQGD